MEKDPSASEAKASQGRAGRAKAWVERSLVYQRAAAFSERRKRWMPLLFFFGGVLWDVLTLDRIGAWFDNLILLVYLMVLGGLILAATLLTYERAASPRLMQHRRWLPHAIQFFLGALFSAYVVFYFQSATLAPSSVFLVLLVVLLVANEFIHQRLFNLYLLLGLYFLAGFSFFLFFIPVVTKTMGYGMFWLAGLLSLGLLGAMLAYLRARSIFASTRQFVYAAGVVVALFGLLNVFYLLHWIPPVPLAMRFGGVFHHASREGPVFDLRYEQPAWYQFWVDSDQRFHYAEGDTVFAFTAVFAPTRLRKTIYHRWRVYDKAQHAWVSTDRIGYEVEGGRNRGYRGYTFKRNVRPGAWRVDVETDAGRVIGRIRFDVVPVGARVTRLKRVVYE